MARKPTFAERVGKEKYADILKYNREYRKANRERVTGWDNKKRKVLKTKVFAMFGSCCKNCGFTDERALQIDHVNGVPNGQRRLKNNPHRGGTKLYARILAGKEPKEDFQLLCANCNWIKRFINKEYGKYSFNKES